MTFGSPWLLSTLAVPLVALLAYLWVERRPTRYVVAFPNLQVLSQVASRSSGWRRHAVAGGILLALAALCVGAARPKMTLPATQDRATVVLVLDVSGSMRAKDVKPSRLDAARNAIRRFLEELPHAVRVGVVSFSNTAEVITTPTTDRARVREGLDVLLPEFGTAIGDAVERGAQVAHQATSSETGAAPRARGGQLPPATVLFLSDGFQTQGILTPEAGARVAKKLGVPVYTVALGTDEGVIEIFRFGETQTIPVPPDRATLARIAEVTGGEAFDVRDEDRLRVVYERLGKKLGRVDKPQEVTFAFAAAGAVLLAAAAAVAGLWQPRLP